MNPRRTTDPASEPVTLAEAKAHLRIDHADEDSLITALITAAREYAEAYTARAFISQTWIWTLNQWPVDGRERAWWKSARFEPASLFSPSPRYVSVPFGPLISVTSITSFDAADAGTLWASTNYYVAAGQDRIYRRSGAAWPLPTRGADGIEIIYVAGYGASAADVPPPLRHALLELIAHLYRHREPVGAAPATPIPFGFGALLDPYRKRRV
jgi:hypothetical protein